MTETRQQAAQVILERLAKDFLRKSRTIYQMLVVRDHFDQVYNFFLVIKPKHDRQKSIPLHTLESYDLAYLEGVVQEIKQQTQITIQYRGFEELVWPQAQTRISKR
ncbi:acetyl-CoA carboxylase [Pediococcus siamensis]|uniref:acetyl-CoA carboxylase n=1 Tax=Pediococcus siamensis TaxID=381829 RepID=UPI00399FD9CB